MPSEKTTTAIQHEQTYICQTYSRPDFVLERGEGVYLYDTEGQRYLDFVAGIAVNGLGHGDPDIVRTINEQAAKLIHVSNLYHTIPGGELAKLLVEASPNFDRVFFSNSGSEAVEGALKLARKYARDHHGEGKTAIVAFDGSFHGRTMGAIAVTAREKYRQPFMPVMPDVRFATFNDLASVDAAMGDDVCAVIVEPVQGEGGLNVATEAFLQRIRLRCDKHKALFIADEIQCGMGRTGTLWAHEPHFVQVDIMAIAKPLGGGLPIGAILASQQVADSFTVGIHGTTFGGGPLTTAVAKTVLQRINNEAFLAHVRQISAYLDEALQSLAADMPEKIVELRGCGLMRGIRIHGSSSEVRQQCHAQQVLVATAGEDIVRLLPPLIIEKQHVDEAMEKLRNAL